jgi:hypothetical protein
MAAGTLHLHKLISFTAAVLVSAIAEPVTGIASRAIEVADQIVAHLVGMLSQRVSRARGSRGRNKCLQPLVHRSGHQRALRNVAAGLT